MRRNLLGQVRIGETIAILFILMLLIIVGFTFYVRIQRFSVGLDSGKSEDLRAIEIAQIASFLPELQCSSKNIVIDNCLDIMKLENVQNIIKKNQIYYFDELFFSVISVDQIYPNEMNWTIYDNPRNDTSSIFTPIPILLYNATSKKNSLGILRVNYYPLR